MSNVFPLRYGGVWVLVSTGIARGLLRKNSKLAFAHRSFGCKGALV